MKSTERSIPRYNPADEDSDENINFKEILLKHLRFWPYFLASVSVAFLIAFVVNQYTPPKYKIESKFLIKDDNSAMNLFDIGSAGSEGVLPKGQKIANETIILKSRTIAGEVLERLSYDVEYYEEGFFTPKEIYRNPPATAEVDWDHSQLTNGQMKISWTDDKSYELEFLDDEYNFLVIGKEKKIIVDKPDLKQTRFSFGKWVTFPFAKFRINFVGPQKEGSVILVISGLGKPYFTIYG